MSRNEFHGVLAFDGAAGPISVSTPPAEFWPAFPFGTQAAPEPTTLALLGIAPLGAGLARCRR